ncbi:ComEA family DNA-binding protein [Tuanshanicoccus lijuaniae]|uniref:helix-hairpin-helix domain-containing protein n=1 Tax=Aerococcaceae bacterium zg-1292 TaxID=2774330 RepID=UPI0019385D17|nr:ComEA family DNA-binding protein [Aerococcaceae bacterium zg-1292]MBF6978808.1 ComEA family DNA-binding protein [Aerococcaceae bacterium zg-BR22]MBS4455242.1 ComEA family DNA-binding protein [Aerococcaceae bacterium zg-A91]MBS4457948.1 ComEA family DNA-binding protein [Aerococcaceae bacterium zg-BR33]QQA36735.1 ComEA family DNA-binding protein [Aerococcaceae bacterium zg-1292]
MIERKYKGVLAVGAAVLLLIGYQNIASSPQTIDWQSQVGETTQSIASETVLENQEVSETASEIYVDIKGAVKKPGVYRLPQGSRVMDVIEQAGGLLPEAADAQINQAQLLTDQMMIYVPSIAESTAEVSAVPQAFASVPNQESGGKININQADSAQLQTLPGIGQKKAEAIIQYRQEFGSFRAVQDLTNVSGIGEKTLQQLLEYITVEP